jgi:cell division protein FtsW
VPPPLEHRILTTTTLCLLAFGAVMVYSASSPIGVVNGSGSGTGEFVQYLVAAALGLCAMRFFERYGLSLLGRARVRLLLLASFVLLAAVLVPGVGLYIGGARRWFAAGPLQFQPSELMKLALVLWVAGYLAEHPGRMKGFKQSMMPILVVVGPACLLIYLEPDLGTMLVIGLTVAALLIAAGAPMRYLLRAAAVVGLVLALLILGSAYQRARLLGFLHPRYQELQSQIGLGSGGLFGVGLGKSVQKVFYLPEAQTDFILAVIGEELGLLGIFSVVLLYGLIAYAGLRTARRAATRHAKLLSAGLTSLILCQGTLNIFVVLGIAPLTGVPLPFISYAPTNLCVLLSAIGLLQNVSRPRARQLRAVDEPIRAARAQSRGERPADSDRSRRHSGARGAGAGGRRRAAG